QRWATPSLKDGLADLRTLGLSPTSTCSQVVQESIYKDTGGPSPPFRAGTTGDLQILCYSRLLRNSGVSPCSHPASSVNRSVRSRRPSRTSSAPAIRSTQPR